MTSPVSFHLVDAFTDRPFAGNPAGVCLLDAPADPVWMQAVAAEVNASETAFVVARANGDYDLRWFTPACEVQLCGHATLASAFVLFTAGRGPRTQPIRFHTLSGVLACRMAGDWVEMDFPRQEVTRADSGADVEALAAALGATPPFIGHTAGASHQTWFAVYDQADQVRSLGPDMARLRQAGGCAIVSAPGDGSCDFVSRFFAPVLGIDEDPVTGSAHCSLGPYWSARLGRDALVAHQVSRRGGVVRVRSLADRVLIAGQAVLTVSGRLARP